MNLYESVVRALNVMNMIYENMHCFRGDFVNFLFSLELHTRQIHNMHMHYAAIYIIIGLYTKISYYGRALNIQKHLNMIRMH